MNTDIHVHVCHTYSHHMEQLLGTTLMTVDHLAFIVPRGQRTMKFIVHRVDLG